VLMGVGMIIFWGLVIFGVVWLVRTVTQHRVPWSQPQRRAECTGHPRSHLPRAISVEEYRERRDLLTGSSPGR
jgi:hypothetical protein